VKPEDRALVQVAGYFLKKTPFGLVDSIGSPDGPNASEPYEERLLALATSVYEWYRDFYAFDAAHDEYDAIPDELIARARAAGINVHGGIFKCRTEVVHPPQELHVCAPCPHGVEVGGVTGLTGDAEADDAQRRETLRVLANCTCDSMAHARVLAEQAAAR
jgi:hypothetical protein